MSRLIIFLIGLSFLSCPSFLRAQSNEFPLVGVTYQYDRLKKGDTVGQVNNFDFFLSYPIKKLKKGKIIGRTQFTSQTIADLDDAYNHTLYGIETNIFWDKNLSNQNKLNLFTQIGIFSDLEDISGKDFRYSIGMRYLNYWHEKLKMGYGIGYSKQFSGHQINPFLYIDYQINPKLKLTGLLPVRPKLMYQINDKVSWSNEFFGNLTTFRLSETEYNNSFIRINNWYYLSKMEFLVRKHHMFSFGAGFDFIYNLKFYNDNQANTVTLFTFDLNKSVKPISELKTKGIKFQIGYRFVL
ncbi:DUF6268 family outer membrane beta-barrel protein [Flavobacterium sp. U410]